MPWESADGGKVVLLSEERERVRELGLDRLETAMTAGTLLRATPYKAISRIDSPRGAVYVKRYDFDRRAVFIRAFLKANFPVFSGPKERENALALREAGLPAPRPLAAGEDDVGWRRRSFVALEELPGTPLERLAPSFEERRKLIGRVAALVKKLHDAGFAHRDLYLANIIAAPSGELGLVDLERVRRFPRGLGDRARRKDLAALDLTALAPWSSTDRIRFLREYLGTLSGSWKRLARKVRAKARSMGRRGKKG